MKEIYVVFLSKPVSCFLSCVSGNHELQPCFRFFFTCGDIFLCVLVSARVGMCASVNIRKSLMQEVDERRECVVLRLPLLRCSAGRR